MKYQTVREDLHARLSNAIAAAGYGELDPQLHPTQNPKHGDYQSNVAHGIDPKNKQAIASKIIENLDISGVAIASQCAGFINLTLEPSYREDKIQEMVSHPSLGVEPVENPEHIIVDYSSPNMAKEMHLGHLRSTLIGEAITQMLKTQGHTVTGISHVGDWGTPMATLISYIQREDIDLDSLNSEKLLEIYRDSKVLFSIDKEFQQEAREAIAKLQDKDPSMMEVWSVVCDRTRGHFNEIYDILNIHPEERGESTYQDRLASVLEDLREKGLIVTDDGAECIFLDDQQPPVIFKKSDGGFTYAAVDITALRERLQEADKVIYVTDHGQSHHFASVFEVVRRADGVDGDRMIHVPFGLVLSSEGKKMSSRSGESMSLLHLLKMLNNVSPRLVDILKLAELSHNRKSSYTSSGLIAQVDSMTSHLHDSSLFERASFTSIEILEWPHVLKEAIANYNPTALYYLLWKANTREEITYPTASRLLTSELLRLCL